MKTWSKGAVAVALVTAVALTGGIESVAGAAMKREGTWPEADKKVSLELEHTPRRVAVRKLADAAGWSVVLPSGLEDPVDLAVKDQPADKVLDVLLGEGTFVAKREGDLVSIASVVTALPAPASATAGDAADKAPEGTGAKATDRKKRGDDKVVTGGNLRIEKDEVVRDVAVYGGNVDVYGTVTGDLLVVGGNAYLHDGARVQGDAHTVAGNLDLAEGAHVDGDTRTFAGNVSRAGSKAHATSTPPASASAKVTVAHDDEGDGDTDDDKVDQVRETKEHGRSKKMSGLVGLVQRAGHAVTSSALLFVFGAVLLALVTPRMETLKLEAAARPMRSFAVGVVGSIAAVVLLAALCITLVGIPVAIVGLLLGILAAYAGICAVLTTAGELLLRHRTQNPYVHLAAGCALFLVLGHIPFFGGFVTALVTLMGIGVFLATSGAGLLPGQRLGMGPYRTAAT